MINQTIIAHLSVKDFFLASNWQGQPSKFLFFPQPATDTTAQLRLNLEEFFSQNNWKGSAILAHPKPTQTEKALSLTLSIQDYFQLNAWKGKPAVAIVPKYVALPEPKTKMAQKFQVKDLSNSF